MRRLGEGNHDRTPAHERGAVTMLRQGDVLLVPVASVPQSAKVQKVKGRIVLAHGEVTGHAHTVDGRRAQLLIAEGGMTYLTVEQLTEVRHQEHAPMTLQPGKYKVVRQREYTPEAIRNVAD